MNATSSLADEQSSPLHYFNLLTSKARPYIILTYWRAKLAPTLFGPRFAAGILKKSIDFFKIPTTILSCAAKLLFVTINNVFQINLPISRSEITSQLSSQFCFPINFTKWNWILDLFYLVEVVHRTYTIKAISIYKAILSWMVVLRSLN